MTPLSGASDLLRNTRASSCLCSPKMSGEQCRRIALEENSCSGSSYYSLLLKNNKPPISHNLPNPLPLHPQHTHMWKHTCSKERTNQPLGYTLPPPEACFHPSQTTPPGSPPKRDKEDRLQLCVQPKLDLNLFRQSSSLRAPKQKYPTPTSEPAALKQELSNPRQKRTETEGATFLLSHPKVALSRGRSSVLSMLGQQHSKGRVCLSTY